MGWGLHSVGEFFRRRRHRRRSRRPPRGSEKVRYQKSQDVTKNLKSGWCFTESENDRGNYRSEINKKMFLKIDIWNSGYHGSLRLQKVSMDASSFKVCHCTAYHKLIFQKLVEKSNSSGPSKNVLLNKHSNNNHVAKHPKSVQEPFPAARGTKIWCCLV